MLRSSIHRLGGVTLIIVLQALLLLCIGGNDAASALSEGGRKAQSAIEDFYNFLNQAYQIRVETTSIAFGSATDSKEIEFELAVSKPEQTDTSPEYTPPEPTLQLFNHDCSTAISDSELITYSIGDVEPDVKIIDGIPYEIRKTVLDVDTTKLAGSSIFEYLEDTETAKIQLCVRADIGLVTLSPGVESSISSVKIKFDIRLNMNEDFSYVQEIASVGEASGGGVEGSEQVAEFVASASNVPSREFDEAEKRLIETSLFDNLVENLDPESITVKAVKLLTVAFFLPEEGERKISSANIAHRDEERSLRQGALDGGSVHSHRDRDGERTLQSEVENGYTVEFTFSIEAVNTDFEEDLSQKLLKEYSTLEGLEIFFEVLGNAIEGDFLTEESSFGIQAELTSTDTIYQSATIDLDYDINVCHCDTSTMNCHDANQKVSQNSLFMLCVNLDTDQVVIRSISSLKLTQNGVVYDAVANSEAADPSVTNLSAMGTTSEAVVTRMISIFFDGSTDKVGISMTIILRFADSSSTARQLVSMNSSIETMNEIVRKLQDDPRDTQSIIKFDINLDVDGVEDDSAAGMIISDSNAQNYMTVMAVGLSFSMLL